MVIIPSARKRDIRGHKNQTLFGKTIQLSTEVQYLELTFDKRLTWKKQLDKVTNKANTAFWTCRCMFRKVWGLTNGFTGYTPWWYDQQSTTLPMCGGQE
jgi:hypothetical protein